MTDQVNQLKQTLDKWIPIILAAQEPDGYLQTAFTLRDKMTPGSVPAADRAEWTERWQSTARGNHEGYVSGYFGKWHHGTQSGKRPGFDTSASFVGQGKYFDCPIEVDGVATRMVGVRFREVRVCVSQVSELLRVRRRGLRADVPGRHEPGTGEINFAWLLPEIDRLGYAGWIGCEYNPLNGTLEGLAWAKPWL